MPYMGLEVFALQGEEMKEYICEPILNTLTGRLVLLCCLRTTLYNFCSNCESDADSAPPVQNVQRPHSTENGF